MSSVLELGYRYIIPSLRRRLVEILHQELKLSKVEVARKLGLSPSAVSRYLSRERGATLDIHRLPMVEEGLRKLAEGVTRGDLDTYAVEEGLLRIALQAAASRLFCKYHLSYFNVNPLKCRICPELFGHLLQGGGISYSALSP
jgi:predicted transcriptional regulator